MAKAKKEDSLAPSAPGTLADLIGNSIAIKLTDGTSVIVPVDKTGNRIANMVMAADIRHAITSALKRYRDQDLLPTPKDLKDMAEAASTLNKFSGEVYKDEEATLPTEQKKVESKPKPADDVSFDTPAPDADRKP